MFPISSDGVFEDPCAFFKQDGFLQDLLADIPILEKPSVKKRARKAPPSSAQVEENNNGGSSESKKSAHRSIEKQRRQEMAALYASLRSLLPLEYIKGKRAVSDHMHQATIYIDDMKKKIGELKVKRESLRNVATTAIKNENIQINSNANHDSSPNDFVKINLFTDGIEILISSSLNKECFPLSMVFADLLGRQLDVVNCFSSRGHRCYIHKIHIQLNDSTSIDLSELQERLVNLLASLRLTTSTKISCP